MVDISIVVVAFEMARELPRTLLSLAPPYQRRMNTEAVEIIVVDNGSKIPLDQSACTPPGANVRFIEVPDPSPSPARAANIGLAAASANLVGLWIDGARLASPGVLRCALDAHRADPEALIATTSFHLGPEPQQSSTAKGYDCAAEDALLESIAWPDDGYLLFGISVFAPSAHQGWLSMNESNGLFLKREIWQALGGLDERFRLAGGGLVNLDLFARALAQSLRDPIVLLGEGTFHQVHGGISTNRASAVWPLFVAEYEEIRGRPYQRPQYTARYFGSMPTAALKSLSGSIHSVLNSEDPAG